MFRTYDNPALNYAAELNVPVILVFIMFRTYDNPALNYAAELNVPVIPVFVWNEREEGLLAAGKYVDIGKL